MLLVNVANPRQAIGYQLPSTKYLKQPPGNDNDIVGCIKKLKLSTKLSPTLPGTKRGLKSVSHWESHAENLSRSCCITLLLSWRHFVWCTAVSFAKR